MQELSSHLSNGSGGHNRLGSPVPSGSVAQPRLARHSQLGRAQLDDYASQVMALDEEGESFVQKIHRLFTEAGALARPPFNIHGSVWLPQQKLTHSLSTFRAHGC